jgi:hypothetical protein
MALGVRYGGPGRIQPGIPGGKGPNRATEFVVKPGPTAPVVPGFVQFFVNGNFGVALLGAAIGAISIWGGAQIFPKSVQPVPQVAQWEQATRDTTQPQPYFSKTILPTQPQPARQFFAPQQPSPQENPTQVQPQIWRAHFQNIAPKIHPWFQPPEANPFQPQPQVWKQQLTSTAAAAQPFGQWYAKSQENPEQIQPRFWSQQLTTAATAQPIAQWFAPEQANPTQTQPVFWSSAQRPSSNVRYVIGAGSAINGNGLYPYAATTPGGDGAYISPPSNSFASNIEWRMVSGNTLDMGAVQLTTGNNATIVKFGTAANFIINGTNATLLNSSTATGVSVSDLNLVRTGGVSGTGYNVGQTTNTNIQRCTITGSGVNIDANDAVGLVVNASTLGASSTEYGIRTTQATTTCSGFTFTGNTFNGGIGIALQASNASNAAGKYTGLTITGNTFNASASSAIIMQSVMNLTGSAHTLQVTSGTTIDIASGSWPAWTAGQVIFLTGFNNVANYGAHTVVSIVGATLTVSGAALTVEAAGANKGAGLIDTTRMFTTVEIATNVCTSQSQTPMLLASIDGTSRIHHNTISGQVGSGRAIAAAIELGYCQTGLTVDFNTISSTTGFQLVDNAGIFLDGGCDGVVVADNAISNVVPGGQDNSGQGTAFFYAQNCTVERNTLTNCYRGTWAGGSAGGGNIIRNNSYTSCDIGIDINCSVPVGAFDYGVTPTWNGNTFSGNRIDIFSCPDGLTLPEILIRQWFIAQQQNQTQTQPFYQHAFFSPAVVTTVTRQFFVPLQVDSGASQIQPRFWHAIPNVASIYTITPTGQIVFSGTITTEHIRQITPSGNITFSGIADRANINVVEPSGTLTFSGTGSMLFIPAGGTSPLTRIPMTGAGIT